MAEAVLYLAGIFVQKLIDEVRMKVVRAIITVIRITGPSDQQAVRARARARARPEEMSLNSYALLRAYVLMAVTGLGFLALTWSTVVLLGGFVTSLGKKDFWCLTSISMVQAARIFNDAGDNLFPIFVNLTEKLVSKVFANPLGVAMRIFYKDTTEYSQTFTVLWVQVILFILQILCIPVLVVVLIAGILYVSGPVACIVLSLWRLWQHDYGNTEGDDSKANLVPALTIFYSLVIFQGVFYFLWQLIEGAAMLVVISFCADCQLPEKWGTITVVDYLLDTREKCWRDPTSIDGRNLIKYAVELVDSESQKDYLSGARMLDNFIKLEADVRSLLLPSRPKIQKLIDTLGWRSSNRELREVVARIVAYLAGDIHLSQFPGATHCISSLLDTTLPYWNNHQGPNHHSVVTVSESKKDTGGARRRLISGVKGIEEYIPKKGTGRAKDVVEGTKENKAKNDRKQDHYSPVSESRKDTGGAMERLISGIEEYRPKKGTGSAKENLISVVEDTEDNQAKNDGNQGRGIRQDAVGISNDHGSKGGGWNELILQGLTILERLVFDQHNCNNICNTPGLLPKIMAPLYSETLIQDINVSAWADVANGSLKVVHRLIRAPEWIGKSDLVHKICSNEHALSNMERILYQGKNDGTELQMRAIEILTELAFDSSANLSTDSKENLIEKQLQIFLTDDEGDKDGLNKKKDDKGDKGKLRVTAGKSLALLSKMETISKFIMKEQNNEDHQNSTFDRHNEIVDTENNIVVRLNEILDANNITYRTIALEILENLCTHCTLDKNYKDYVKEALLPKIIKEVLAASKRDLCRKQRYFSEWGGSLPDIEQTNAMKTTFARKKHEVNQAISGPGDDEENQAISEPEGDEENQAISESGGIEENQSVSGPESDEDNQAISGWENQIKPPDQANEKIKAKIEFREALLSLTYLVMCNNLISADDFDDVARKISLGEGEFVGKLRDIVEDNCKDRADCLRIVKLCGQIAVLMLQPSQDTTQLKKFLKSLKRASKIMSNLESCMLFAGTDCGVKKTAKPLLSDLVEEVQELIGN